MHKSIFRFLITGTPVNTWLFLFQINGFSLDRVTHNEAVQHFVNAGETVTLRVLQGAEEAILVSKELEWECQDTPY